MTRRAERRQGGSHASRPLASLAGRKRQLHTEWQYHHSATPVLYYCTQCEGAERRATHLLLSIG